MTDKQFEKIKKGLQFHSEGGIDNLCTMTETTLRAILDDATKELEAQIENDRDLPAIAYMQGAEKQKKKDEEELTKAKEIIENLLYYVKQCTCERSNYAEIEKDIKGAEQFLSGVEK